jgi:formate dehydrogenase major subunit
VSDPPAGSGRGTVCPLCGVGCRLAPSDDTDRSRARGVAGPANPNGRLCRKGIGAFDRPADRITHPRVRRDDDWHRVSWATALDGVADRIRTTVAAHGPDALAFLGAPRCTNEANYLLSKLARLLGTNNVDNRARLCHATTARVLGERLGLPATTGSLEDLAASDVILVAGANPARRQPVAFDSFVRPAVADGTTLVHFDPVGNRTTRLADVHVPLRPGTDAAVFDLLSGAVLDRGGVDREFVDRRTRGFDDFATGLAKLDRGATAAAAGVDPETVDRVADLIADADRVAGLVGTGVEASAGDASAPAALVHLLLSTGNVGRRGTGVYLLRGLVNEQGATDAGCVPDRLPGYQPVTDAGARSRVAAEWGVEPPPDPGGTASELLADFGDGVRCALVVGENPAVSKRDRDWIRQQLRALETLVVVDLAPSATTRHADVVLPATAGVETAGTVTNLERRVQRLRPTASPPAEARPEFDILAGLGGRLFPDGHFDYPDVAAVFDELTRVAPTHADLSYAALDAGGRQWPADGDGTLYRERFETPDGRAAFGSVQQPPDPPAADGLDLVVGGRASEFADADPDDRALRIHPEDAGERGVGEDDTVAVSDDGGTVAATARLDDRVRRGTVYLPASVADPFQRRGSATVDIEAVSEPKEEARTGDEREGADDERESE